MSKLEELIQELCPNGVQYCELKEIADISTGSHNTNEGVESGMYPFYVRSQEPLTLNSYDYDETAIITAGDGVGVGKVFHFVNGKYALHQRAYRIHANTTKVEDKFLYYYFCTNFMKYIEKTMFKGSVPSIRRPMLNAFKIPVPPLEVQQEIIHLLDDFTAKTAELQAELNKEYEARKKQYEYYRDTLLMQKSLFINNNKTTDFLYDIELICSKVNVELSKDPEIKEQQCSYYKEIIKTYNETGKIPSSLEQTKKMSIIKIIQYLYGYANVNLLDVANNYTGLTYKPSDKADYGTLVLRSSNIVNNRLAYDDNVFVQMETIPQRAIAKENDILVCVRNGSRALIGKSAIIPHTQTPMAFGAFMTVLRANPTLLNYKYLYFVWQTNYVQNLIHGDEAMPINQITNKEFKRIHFALPTLNEQNALVQKLEKLEETSFELQSNISVELESRQKQYEYYRDKLLTFKELNESEVN